MRKLYFVAILFASFLSVSTSAQVVFSDDFSTNTSATYTTTGAIGASVWSVTRSADDWGARRNTSPLQLELSNDASATPNVNGWVFASVNTSSFTAPYNTTLASNTDKVSWSFNMRQIRTDPSGFNSGSYGVAFILGTTSTTANNSGTGYAVVLGNTTGTDPVRLVKFSAGIQSLSVTAPPTANDIVVSNTTGLTDFGANYLSVRVEYTPSTNTWELFLRDDGATAFTDPATGTLISQGTAVDNTYTSVSLGFMGGYWQGSTTATQTAFFDNVNVSVAISNTITTGTLSSTIFNLANCAATTTGSIDFTSTGTFAAGNDYTVQLSDAIGSFSIPVVIGNFPSTANSGTINFTIPAGTPTGTGYKLRIVSTNPAVTSNLTVDITINQSGLCGSSPADYFRSIISGNWGDFTTWESSTDNSTWQPATIAPTSNANTILIRNGHTVTIAAGASADQLTIEAGATLNHSSGQAFVLNNGTGVDMTVNGTYVLNGTQPTGTGTVEILSGAIVRVNQNSPNAESDDFAYNGGTTTNIFRTGSLYDWNNTSTPSWSNRTYFTTGENTTFRFSQSPTFGLGGNNPTTIHGVLEPNAAINLSGSGNKTFVNGILGSANIGVDITTPFTGNILITGAAAVLGGAGTVTLPASPSALQIGTTSLVTMTSSKTIAGDVTLLANSYINLGSFNLTVSGAITGGTTNYIRTNGTGSLILNNITGTRNAPMGNSTYNPLIITNTGGYNWTLRVEDAVAVGDPTFIGNIPKAVQREWHITPSTNPPATGADITFEWNDGGSPSQVGVNYNPNENVQAWHEVSQGSPWGDDWLAAGPAQPAGGTAGGVRTAAITNWTRFSPFAVSNISGPLPVRLTSFTATKVNDRNARITWELAACCSRNARFELQKSTDGVGFSSIKSVEGSETSRFYEQYDINLGAGITYYRLKAIDVDGKITYSRVAAIINGTQGLVVSAPTPNPVSEVANVVVTLGKKETVAFMLADVNGRMVRQWQSNLPEGNTVVNIPAEVLPAGIYYLSATAGAEKSVVRFVKQ